MALINTTTTGVLGTTVYGDGQGALTVQQDGATINKIVNTPVFRIYTSSNQTISTSTWTKVNFNVKEFDTSNIFDATTNYRLTPNIAGYYQINFGADLSSSASQAYRSMLAKNGSGNWISYSAFTQQASAVYNRGLALGSTVVYMNGTTDYLEVYAYIDAGTSPTVAATTYSHFSGFLVKAI